MTPEQRNRFILVHYPFANTKDLAEHVGLTVAGVRSIAHRAGVFHAGGKVMNIDGILCKLCPCCGVTKPMDDFYTDETKPCGLASHCIVCTYKNKEHKCPTCHQSIK